MKTEQPPPPWTRAIGPQPSVTQCVCSPTLRINDDSSVVIARRKCERSSAQHRSAHVAVFVHMIYDTRCIAHYDSFVTTVSDASAIGLSTARRHNVFHLKNVCMLTVHSLLHHLVQMECSSGCNEKSLRFIDGNYNEKPTIALPHLSEQYKYVCNHLCTI